MGPVVRVRLVRQLLPWLALHWLKTRMLRVINSFSSVAVQEQDELANFEAN
jgi:hypothetical protein